MGQPYEDILRASTAVSYAAFELQDGEKDEQSCFDVIRLAVNQIEEAVKTLKLGGADPEGGFLAGTFGFTNPEGRVP